MKKKQQPIKTFLSLRIDEMLAQPFWQLPDTFKDEEWKKSTKKELFEAVLYLHEKLDHVYMMLNTERFTKQSVLYSVQRYLKKFEDFGKTKK